jgi:hypothetical protein
VGRRRVIDASTRLTPREVPNDAHPSREFARPGDPNETAAGHRARAGCRCLPPMRWSAGHTGTDIRGQTRLRPRHLVCTHAFHRSDGAPKARAKLLPGLQAGALQPTPSPDRSPSPARQPALAPGLSLVPHGCGDPLIRLVQAPRNNRVLEGWEHQLDAAEAAPCVREAGGQGRLSCRARGPVARSTAGFKGAGVSKEGPRSFVRPLFGRSTAKRSNEGVAGGLRPPTSSMPEQASRVSARLLSSTPAGSGPPRPSRLPTRLRSPCAAVRPVRRRLRPASSTTRSPARRRSALGPGHR